MTIRGIDPAPANGGVPDITAAAAPYHTSNSKTSPGQGFGYDSHSNAVGWATEQDESYWLRDRFEAWAPAFGVVLLASILMSVLIYLIWPSPAYNPTHYWGDRFQSAEQPQIRDSDAHTNCSEQSNQRCNH